MVCAGAAQIKLWSAHKIIVKNANERVLAEKVVGRDGRVCARGRRDAVPVVIGKH